VVTVPCLPALLPLVRGSVNGNLCLDESLRARQFLLTSEPAQPSKGNKSPVSFLSGTIGVCGLLALQNIIQSLGGGAARIARFQCGIGLVLPPLGGPTLWLMSGRFGTIGVAVVDSRPGKLSVGAIESVNATRYYQHL
jgi:hypothetical protein